MQQRSKGRSRGSENDDLATLKEVKAKAAQYPAERPEMGVLKSKRIGQARVLMQRLMGR